MNISSKLKSRDAGKQKAEPKLSKDKKSNKPAQVNSPGITYFAGNPE